MGVLCPFKTVDGHNCGSVQQFCLGTKPASNCLTGSTASKPGTVTPQIESLMKGAPPRVTKKSLSTSYQCQLEHDFI